MTQRENLMEEIPVRTIDGAFLSRGEQSRMFDNDEMARLLVTAARVNRIEQGKEISHSFIRVQNPVFAVTGKIRR